MPFDLGSTTYHLAEGGWGGPAGQGGRGQAFTPFTNTVILQVWNQIKTVGQHAALISLYQVEMFYHLEEPLILCDDHLNHSGQSGSDSNVHWIVNCFWLPKLHTRDFDQKSKVRIVRNWYWFKYFKLLPRWALSQWRGYWQSSCSVHCMLSPGSGTAIKW